MSKRAQMVITRMNEGVDIRTAISEAVGIAYEPIVDKLEKDSKIAALAKKGAELEIVDYIHDNFEKLGFERKLTGKVIRRIARELVARKLTGAGGK